MKLKEKMAHHYRRARAWQALCAANGDGALTVYPSGRTERSFGSAPYGEHALSAWMSAKRAVYFRAELARMVKARRAR